MTALLPAIAVVLGLLAAQQHWPIALLVVPCCLIRRAALALLLALAWMQGGGYGWTCDSRAWHLPNWAMHWQDIALDVLGRGLTGEQARLLGGMILGRTAAGFTLQDYPHWVNAGMAHLLVASGAQVTLLVFPLVWVLHHLDLAPRHRRLLALVILAQVGFVLLLTGLDPSILRAATLAVWLLSGLVVGEPVLPLIGLARVAACWLLLDPSLLESASFQLSYAATFGLLVLTPLLDEALPERLSPRWRALVLLAGATLAAQLAVAPVLWSWFGRVEPAGLLTNLIAVPLAEWLIWLGMLKSVVVGLGLPTSLLNGCIALDLTLLDAIARWGAQFRQPSMPPLPGLLAVNWLLLLGLLPAAIRARRIRLLQPTEPVPPRWRIIKGELPPSEPLPSQAA